MLQFLMYMGRALEKSKMLLASMSKNYKEKLLLQKMKYGLESWVAWMRSTNLATVQSKPIHACEANDD